jgi:circadian clock protein KaiC
MKEKKITSGIENMDPLLGGGFPKKSIIAYHGSPGSGKTICSLFFLLSGLKHNEKVLYVTFEEGKENILRLSKNIGIDFEKYLKDGNLIIRDFSKLVSEKGLEKSITEKIKESNITRVVIDSITTAAIDHIREDNNLAIKKFIRNLLRNLREIETTSIIISRDEAEYETLVGLSDCAIFFQSHSIGDQGLSSCNIIKVRLSKHDKRIQYLDLTKNGKIKIAKDI